jgi:hypothetical protein
MEKYYGLLSDVYDRLSKWRDLRRETHTKLRLLFLECRRNLEILEVIELEKTNGIHTDDEDFKSAANALSIEVIEMVFLGEKGSGKLYEILRKKMRVTETTGHGEDEDESHEREMSVMQAIVYLYVKIATLKKILSIERKGSALKKIYYRSRLSNIKVNFLNIVKMLSCHGEVKEILCDQPMPR